MKGLLKKHQILLSILLLLVMMLGYILPNSNIAKADIKVASIIQTQLMSDKEILSDILLDLQEILITSGKTAYEKQSLNYQQEYKDRFAFFLYQDLRLNLWTDNHIPIPIHLDSISNENFQSFGSYRVLITKNAFHQFELLGLQIVKYEYPWQNDYLVDHIAPYFNVSSDISISLTQGTPIKDDDGKTFFYTQITKLISSDKVSFIPLLLFLLSFLVLTLLLRFTLSKYQKQKPYLALGIFGSVIIIWFLAHLFFELPISLFQSQLFSSSLYASAFNIRSLGDLFFGSLALLAIVIYYYSQNEQQKGSKWRIFLYLVFSLFLFYAILVLLFSLVFDSQIILNLHQLASLNIYSYVVLLMIFIIQFSWFLLLDRWIGLWPFIERTKIYRSIKVKLFLFLLFFTIITTGYLNMLNKEKELQLREVKALSFDLENDPFLESTFFENKEKIASDQHISQIYLNHEIENYDQEILQYINETYFKQFQNTYLVNLIFCHSDNLITILPGNTEVPCYEYFNSRISETRNINNRDCLYLIESEFQFQNYIGIINYEFADQLQSKIFIEFVSTVRPKELGLPTILEKSYENHSRLMRNYSYAIYRNGLLTERYGLYDYKQKLMDYRLANTRDHFFKKDKFDHYLYSRDENNTVLISKRDIGILQELAAYAFIFLLFGMFLFLMYVLVFNTFFTSSTSHFQERLQYSMIFLLLFSFLLIGSSSLYYIYYLNKNKNQELLMEKAHSVLIELEHKLGGLDELQANDKNYVGQLLFKFSEVFFTDITLYSKSGELLASSRPEVFTSSLFSNRMDAKAYYELNFLKNSFFIQDEKIGKQSFLSAYLPFRNQDNKSVAYLNLPYFAKQFELEEEVSGFIVTFLNIYLFLLFITIIISIIISRYLSKPLLLIKTKMQHLDLEQKNEKIEWHRNDEIGELVKEYNRMVDELILSAQKMAITQRESAWREMAQQIAHEIKNPLTPMMLNVQYLQKAWADGAEGYEERMRRITEGLKEQITVLSHTADQFSTFATINETTLVQIELKTIIKDVISIFNSNKNITYKKVFITENNLVLADKNQMIRILNNIYKNAIQAIGDHKEGRIITELSTTAIGAKIIISDNGCGIKPEELNSIFEPHFTTKSSGMGLGLSLVKKMVENVGGEISVKSQLDKGSSFSLFFPIKNPKKV